MTARDFVAPAGAPSESVEDARAAAPTNAAAPASVAVVPPAGAPSESVDEVRAVAPVVRAAAAAVAATAEAAPPAAVPRSVDLPVRPRLRVSYWFEGDQLKCEAALMNEGRELVHRAKIPADGDTVARVFGFFANLLAADLKAGGALVNMPASTPAAESSEPITSRDGSSA